MSTRKTRAEWTVQSLKWRRVVTNISTVLFAVASLAVLSAGAARAEDNEAATRTGRPATVTAAMAAPQTDADAGLARAARDLPSDPARDAGNR